MTSSNVINGQVHTRQVITNIQYQIVGVYWMNDSTSFVDWYFDVMKAQTGSRKPNTLPNKSYQETITIKI
jgi:hypothetical protein